MSRETRAWGRFQPSAVLFDLDGTTTFHFQDWAERLAEGDRFIFPAEDAWTQVGKTRTILQVLLECAGHEDESFDRRTFTCDCVLAAEQLLPVPGLSEYLDALKLPPLVQRPRHFHDRREPWRAWHTVHQRYGSR